MAGVLLLVVAQDGTRTWGVAVSDAAGLAAAVLIVGLYAGTRRAYLAALRDRARRLEIERDQSSALAAAEERARIAREMHDSVAHHLTVIVALSDGALRAVTRAPADAADAIRDVSRTARQALAETRSLLGVLRADSGPEPRQPLPGLADLDDLLGRVRSAGLPVRYERTGTARTWRPPSSLPSSGSPRAPPNLEKHAARARARRSGCSSLHRSTGGWQDDCGRKDPARGRRMTGMADYCLAAKHWSAVVTPRPAGDGIISARRSRQE